MLRQAQSKNLSNKDKDHPMSSANPANKPEGETKPSTKTSQKSSPKPAKKDSPKTGTEREVNGLKVYTR